MSSTITMIKKDALINLQVSTGFLQKIQQMLAAMAVDKSEEEIEVFKKLLEQESTEFPEQWMEHIYVLSSLVKTIEAEAVKQGFTYEKSLDDISTQES